MKVYFVHFEATRKFIKRTRSCLSARVLGLRLRQERRIWGRDALDACVAQCEKRRRQAKIVAKIELNHRIFNTTCFSTSVRSKYKFDFLCYYGAEG